MININKSQVRAFLSGMCPHKMLISKPAIVRLNTGRYLDSLIGSEVILYKISAAYFSLLLFLILMICDLWDIGYIKFAWGKLFFL